MLADWGRGGGGAALMRLAIETDGTDEGPLGWLNIGSAPDEVAVGTLQPGWMVSLLYLTIMVPSGDDSYWVPTST